MTTSGDIILCAEKVAEYLILARSLKETSSQEDYDRANHLAWELAMWLPENVYKQLGHALVNPEIDPLSMIIVVRKMLLGNGAGNLTGNDIIVHAPGIGIKRVVDGVIDSYTVEVDQHGGSM